MYTGIREVTVNGHDDWNILWQAKDNMLEIKSLPSYLQDGVAGLAPNEFVFFKYGNDLCPTMHKKDNLMVMKDKSNGAHHGKQEYKGIHAKNIEQRCAMEILADENIPLVCLLGKAGTGKTLLSLAVSLEYIERGLYDKIIVIKPLIPVGGKDIGALPGDKWEKLSAWLGPMRDNIQQLLHAKADGKQSRVADASFEELVEEGKIEVEAMAFIQGRSIPNSVVIVDESQNLTPREARMVVERCGKGSKLILLGDLTQVENPFLDSRSCGLAHAVNGGKKQEDCATVTLSKVERSKLAALASEIFKSPEARR
jgi:PhoH-like ATPase